MRPSLLLSTFLFTSTFANPLSSPQPLDERQLATTNPTQDLTEVIKLATALNKFLTGDNIDRLNSIINKTDALLTPENLLNLDITIDGGALLLQKDIVAKIIALIELILSLLTPGFIGGSQTMVPLVNKALPLFGKSMGFNLPV